MPSGPLPSRLGRVRAGRERGSAFYRVALERGAVVAWGDDEGLSPWEDDEGDLLVPLWPDETAAAEENEGRADDGEAPVVLSLAALGGTLQDWLDHEVDAVAFHPRAGHIASAPVACHRPPGT